MFSRRQAFAFQSASLNAEPFAWLGWLLLVSSPHCIPQLTNGGLVYKSGAAQVEALRTESGFDRHRGLVSVCGAMTEVTTFAADVENFPEWVSFTEESRLISRSPERTVFYLRNSAPWPFKSRDMVYELIPDVYR